MPFWVFGLPTGILSEFQHIFSYVKLIFNGFVIRMYWKFSVIYAILLVC